LQGEFGGVGWTGGFPVIKEEVAMKIRLLLATSALVLLPACATTTGNTMVSAASHNDGYDRAYMARVERAARNSGTDITWINPPKLKSDDHHD
jgi:hypothetical protein